MSWTDTLTAVASSLGAGGGGAVAAWRVARKGLINIADDIAVKANKPLQDKLEVVENDIAKMKVSLAVQFGGNGGGMREAINALQVEVAHIKGQLSAATIPVVMAAGKHEAGDAT